MTDTEDQKNEPSPNKSSSVAGGDEISVEQIKARHKGVYLLPNLFTTGAMFSGFYAILAAMDGKFDIAT